ncbi:exported protein of unknown function [Cupriavidus taiwanensis]|uniref:Uncharacterized protein n=1 Tax=Cupriavidus taiwanensis TaxID=164546 RepID=A0A375GQM6_9BURK|nr:exported hypothetical protein [Cupriavidus taiwanensis]SOY90955.1 exported hypothetical protein [Cupriavidus taiwanensis]SPA17155.1 exported hypothetical protein [Cupriavidus taiwanensis]SPA46834.1 exported hypothetical protein [Cupriavidus taiwanensis]SPD42154.1 protein of unknown function [Cupriavidus taiwanensis]
MRCRFRKSPSARCSPPRSSATSPAASPWARPAPTASRAAQPSSWRGLQAAIQVSWACPCLRRPRYFARPACGSERHRRPTVFRRLSGRLSATEPTTDPVAYPPQIRPLAGPVPATRFTRYD